MTTAVASYSNDRIPSRSGHETCWIVPDATISMSRCRFSGPIADMSGYVWHAGSGARGAHTCVMRVRSRPRPSASLLCMRPGPTCTIQFDSQSQREKKKADWCCFSWTGPATRIVTLSPNGHPPAILARDCSPRTIMFLARHSNLSLGLDSARVQMRVGPKIAPLQVCAGGDLMS